MIIRIRILLALSVLFDSCTMRMPADFIVSPSRHYKLKVELNRNKSNENKYNCVLLIVCDSSYNELSKLQTGSSNAMKWAVGWCTSRDTVILNSKDVGLYAYRISADGKLIQIPVDKDIEGEGKAIFLGKYPNTK